MTDDALDRAVAHAERFNAAVRSGDWAAFVRTFAPDATMDFTNVPAPSAVGREAILAAYRADPPTDTLTVLGAEVVGAVDVVRFAWADGGLGTMRITWHDDLVAALVVTFG